MTEATKMTSNGIGNEKAQGGGESQGGAYPNPHSGKDPKEPGPDDFMGHGGQSEIGYHGTGQLGDTDVEGRDNANAPTGSD